MSRILIVDDEPNIRELIGTILRLENHEILEASHGREALDVLERNARALPDLIVLDLSMPEMDGWRFLEELYVRGLRKHMRVVIVTGAYESDQPIGTGARVDVLPKPFDSKSLVEMVKEALQRDPGELYERHERSSELARLLSKVDEVLGN